MAQDSGSSWKRANALQMNSPTEVADLKLVLLGESAVGKSSLAQRFTTDTFDDNKESTIGAAFITKKVYLESDTDDDQKLRLINFQIWDTAGQERYKSLTPMYYRNSNIAIIVFDVTDATSFKKADSWYNELKLSNSYDLNKLKVFLVGNKRDLVDAVPRFDANFIIQDDVKILYTSAKTGDGVKELFEQIIASVEDSMFVKVGDLEGSNDVLKRKKSTIIDLTDFNGTLNGSNCSC